MAAASKEIRLFAKRLGKVTDAPIAHDVAELLADEWVDTAVKHMGKDTYLLARSTRVVSVSGGSRAVAILESNTPYAGFHNYGTRFQAPNGYWDAGLATAEQLGNRIGAQVMTEIGQMIASGGAWHKPDGTGV